MKKFLIVLCLLPFCYHFYLCGSSDGSFFKNTLLKTCEVTNTSGNACSLGDHAVIMIDSTYLNTSLILKFENKHYNIPLGDFESSIFSPGSTVTVEENGTTFISPISNFLDRPVYEGTDNEGTYASGYLLNNTFRGFLMQKDGTSIYVESDNYVGNETDSSTSVKQVAYKSEDVKFKDCSTSNGSINCLEGDPSEFVNCKRENQRKISCFMNAQMNHSSLRFRTRGLISKKPTKWPPFRWRDSICTISLIVDSEYYALHSGDLVRLMSELAIVFKQVNKVFVRSADFDGDSLGDGIQFQIGNVEVKATQENSSGDGSVDEIVSNLVEDFRKWPQNDCLALKLVGLRTETDWVSTSFESGICKNNDNEPEPARNVAVVNAVNSLGRQRILSTTVWSVALAVGQLIGSSERDCNSMPLSRRNWTSFFSHCEKENMASVLGRQGSCLTYQQDNGKRKVKKVHAEDLAVNSTCGNGEVNPGEECDCGTVKECRKKGSCCMPPGDRSECRFDRTRGFECDWTDDCCTRDCKIVPQDWNTFCGGGDESCAHAKAYCDGESPRCPVPRSASNLRDGRRCGPATLRQAGAATCKRGRCDSTVCRDAGLVDCTCAVGSWQQCRVCCRKPGTQENPSACAPAEYFGLSNWRRKFFFRHQGTPCSEVRLGHCDKHGSCVKSQNVGIASAETTQGYLHFFTFTLFLFFF